MVKERGIVVAPRGRSRAPSPHSGPPKSLRTRARAVALALPLLAIASVARAQAPAETSLLKQPIFLLQPGITVSNFADVPEGEDTNTEFNFRFVTAIPTSIPRTTLVAIVQFTPAPDANGPSVVYGPVVNLFDWRLFAIDVDAFGGYGPAAEADDEKAYTHKLIFEGDLTFKLGAMLGFSGQWRKLNLYALLPYTATGIPSEASPWGFLTGVSLPIAPWERSKK